MIRRKILRENRIPGAESLTRPEEISEMSKYLGSLIDSKHSDLELDNRLIKVPGKSTGKIPEISELGSPVEKMLESFTNSDIKELDTKIRVGLDIEDSTFDLERESFRNSSAVKLDIADDREIKLSRHKEEVDIKDINRSKHYEEYINSRRKELLSDKSNNGEPKLVDSSRKLLSNQGAEVKKLDNKIESLNVDRVESLGSRKLEEILSDQSRDSEIKLEDEVKRLKVGERISKLPNKSSKLNIGNDRVNLSDFKDIVPGEISRVSKLEDYRDDIDYSRDISLEDYIEGLGGELEDDKLSYYIDQLKLNTSNSGFDGKTLPDSMLTVPSGEFKEVAGNINSYKDELDTGDREVELGTYISSLDVNSGFSGEELPDYSLTIPNNIDGPVELVDSALLVPGDIEEVGLEDKIVNRPDDKFSTYLKDRLKDCLNDLNSDDEIFKFLMDLIAEGRNGGRNSSWEEKLGSLASSYLNTSKISPARVEEYLKELDKVLNVDVIGGRSGDILFDNRKGGNHFEENYNLPNNSNKGYINVEDAFNKKVLVLLEEEKKKEEKKKEDGPWSLRKAATELTLEILVEKKLIERNKVTGDITLPGNNKYLNSLANTIVGIASGEKEAGKTLNEFAVNTIKDAKEDVKKHIKESVLSGVSKYTGLATKKMMPLNKPLRDSVNKGIMKGANELVKKGEEEFDKFFNTSELEVLVGKSDYEEVVISPKPSNSSNKSGSRAKIDKLDKEVDEENKLKATYTTRNFFEDFWSCPAVQTTLQDLCIKSDSLNRGSSINDLKELLKNSPYITTPSKFGTTGIANRGVQSLDVTSYWEVILTPYVSTDEVVGNGGYSFLPCINEINLHNLKHHGVATNYSSWIPFTSFNLQKARLSSKQIQLYSGEVNFPISMENMNELFLTIADDSYKSWKLYFEKCAEVSIYNSVPHTAEYYESKNMPMYPTAVDKSSVCVSYYKNIAFNVKIYVMTPQYGTIRKFNFLTVLKEFGEEYTGDIDGSAPDVSLSMSIVGEIDEIEVPYNSVIEPEEYYLADWGAGTGDIDLYKDLTLDELLEIVDSGEYLVGHEVTRNIDGYFDGEGVEGYSNKVPRKLPNGINLDDLEVFNIDTTVYKRASNMQPLYDKDKCGKCGYGTSEILIAGGLGVGVSHPKQPRDAYNWVYCPEHSYGDNKPGKFLEDFGWIYLGEGLAGEKSLELEPGDLCHCKPANSHSYGHICIYLPDRTGTEGKSWVSDFKQANSVVYSDVIEEIINGTLDKNTVTYWRWPKRVIDGEKRFMSFDIVETEVIPAELSSKDSSASGKFIDPLEPEGFTSLMSLNNYKPFDDSVRILDVDKINEFVSTKSENDLVNEKAARAVSEMLTLGGLVEGEDFIYTLSREWSDKLSNTSWYKIGCGYPPADIQAGDLMCVKAIHFGQAVEDLGYVAYFNGISWISENVQEGWLRAADVWTELSVVRDCYTYWRWPRRIYNGELIEDAVGGSDSDICDYMFEELIPEGAVSPLLKSENEEDEESDETKIKDVSEVFNVDAAISFIQSNIEGVSESKGTASSTMRDILKNGTLSINKSYEFTLAKEWRNTLPQYGWYNIGSSYPPVNLLQPGDIMVISGLPEYSFGHVAIWTGEYWASDFNQGDNWRVFENLGYGGVERWYKRCYTYWRWPKRIYNGELILDVSNPSTEPSIFIRESSPSNTSVNLNPTIDYEYPVLPLPTIKEVSEELDVKMASDFSKATINNSIGHGYAVSSVFNVLEAGGLSDKEALIDTSNGIIIARTLYDLLPDIGWYLIGKGYVPEDIEEGDIMVIDGISGSELGHVAYWNGTNWISDFKQEGWMIFSDVYKPEEVESIVTYWRWPKKKMPDYVELEDLPIIEEDSPKTSEICDDNRYIFPPEEYDYPIVEHETVVVEEILNVIKANKQSYKILGENSTGHAVEYVLNFLRAGGLLNIGLSNDELKGVTFECLKTHLTQYGWYEFAKGYPPTDPSCLYRLEEGDIMLIDHSALGHIAYWNGITWVSDFKQEGWLVFKDINTVSEIDSKVSYWRWPRRIYNGELIEDDEIPIMKDETVTPDSEICDNAGVDMFPPAGYEYPSFEYVERETTEILNVNKSNEFSNNIVNNKSTGKSIPAVWKIYEAGGLTKNEALMYNDIEKEMPTVKYLLDSLPENGWYMFANGFPPDNISETVHTLEQGDLMIIDHKLGHIAYWNGLNWISDFKQEGWMVFDDLKSTEEINSKVSYWRWPKKYSEDTDPDEPDADSDICTVDISPLPEDGYQYPSVILKIKEVVQPLFTNQSNIASLEVTSLESTGFARSSVFNILRAGGLGGLSERQGLNYTEEELKNMTATYLRGTLNQRGWYQYGFGYQPLDLKEGDIMLVERELGHIAYWNGTNWVSDFKQEGWLVFEEYTTQDDIEKNVTYWRWPWRIDKNGTEELD